MPPELRDIFTAQGGVATSAQILDHLSRRGVQRGLRDGEMVKVWPGIYSLGTPSTASRLRGLDLRCGEHVAVCLGTAAAMFGFDTEDSAALHVLNPVGHNLRARTGLVVHRRDCAPLTTFRGRRLTTAPWTAVEVARSLRRARALATLDAALRSRACDRPGLTSASEAQAGRRGIVMVRDLIPLARPQAESAMESEARLAMLDGGLEEPVLQYQIIDRDGRVWRVDFAWPDRMVAVEYDGFDWHSSSEALRHDRQKRAALEELGWRVMSIVSDDVRRQPAAMVRRIDAHLNRIAAA
jgi:very-short-patch-repair endonuclease